MSRTSNPPNDEQALDYSRRLYQNLLDWYNNADQKAQVIITLSGAIIGLSTSFLFFGGSASLTEIAKNPGLETIILLALFILTVCGSIYSSLRCLWSRHISDRMIDCQWFSRKSRKNNSAQGKPKQKNLSARINTDQYKPNDMWFFNSIRQLDYDLFCSQLHSVSKDFEVSALASQIYILSQNVTKKHNWVNIGFLLLALSLLLILAIGINIILRARFL